MAASRTLKIVIAGGGTGGHVLPAIAVHEELQRREAPAEFLWIGSHSGIERGEAERAGIPFIAIQTGKLRRYIDLRTIPDAARLPIGAAQSFRALRSFHPDIVFSTGGFVSVPTVIAAKRFAPVVTHEQTAIVGLANKINTRFSACFAVSFDATASAIGSAHSNVVVTGNPVRSMLRDGDAQRGRERYGFSDELPVIFITGGAKGASPINERIFAKLEKLVSRAQVVHQTGSRNANPDYDRAIVERAKLPAELRARYVPVEYVGPEIADIFAMAALVIARAGAGTVAELAYVGRPAILIPLPHAGGAEQDRNGAVLATAGGAVVIPEVSATPDRLLQEITQLLDRPRQLKQMGENARSISRDDAASALADLLLKTAKR